MSDYDPRTTLAREDLADQALEGLVRARRFLAPTAMQARVAAAELRAAPDAAAETVDQLAYGEAFDVLERRGDWAWGQARRDGMVGWVALAALAEGARAPTHRVAVLEAVVRDGPAADAAETARLPLNALVTADAAEGGRLRLAAGWVDAADLAGLDAFDRDAAAVAERFVGAPYARGGRDRRGLDAAALVQQALYACGLGCPRTADRQAELGQALAAPDQLRRGDLVCWSGHVAMMVDARTLVHADAEAGAVRIEALEAALARSGEPTALRRL